MERGPDARIREVEQADVVVYGEEVLAIIGALTDLVVGVRRIQRILEGEDEEEAE